MELAAMFTRALERAGIPVYGVSCFSTEDPSQWRIDFKPEATPEQQATAEAMKLGYDAATDTVFVDEQATRRFNDEKLIKAVAIWCAQKLGVPLTTARSEIVAIYKAL